MEEKLDQVIKDSMDQQFNQEIYEEQIAELFWKLPRKERRKTLKKNKVTNYTEFVKDSIRESNKGKLRNNNKYNG